MYISSMGVFLLGVLAGVTISALGVIIAAVAVYKKRRK